MYKTQTRVGGRDKAFFGNDLFSPRNCFDLRQHVHFDRNVDNALRFVVKGVAQFGCEWAISCDILIAPQCFGKELPIPLILAHSVPGNCFLTRRAACATKLSGQYWQGFRRTDEDDGYAQFIIQVEEIVEHI